MHLNKEYLGKKHPFVTKMNHVACIYPHKASKECLASSTSPCAIQKHKPHHYQIAKSIYRLLFSFMLRLQVLKFLLLETHATNYWDEKKSLLL